MDIRSSYNEALDKLENDLDGGLRKLIDVYCVAIDSYENDIADSISLYIIDMGNKNTYDYLEEISSMSNDQYLKREFSEWMNEINKKI